MGQSAVSAALDILGQADELHALAREHPVAFIREVLGAKPWDVQERIVRSVFANRRTAVPSCHASGKSFITARIMLTFLFAFPGAKVVSTAPTDRQVVAILWSEFAAAHGGALVPLGGELTLQEYHLDRDWFAIGFAAPAYDPNRFQGFHAPHILVVTDEAAGISPTIMEQIEGIASGGDAHILQIGNPVDPTSSFALECETPGTEVISIDAFQTPNFTGFGIVEEDLGTGAWHTKIGATPLPYPQLITPQWAADVFSKWGAKSPRYISRVRGRFPDVVKHAIYGEEMGRAKAEARITRVPHDETLPVSTAWDLGINKGGNMAIWFFQTVGREVRLIDYRQGLGKGLPEWWRELQALAQERRFSWEEHIAPHDIGVTELGTGKTRLEVAAGLGLRFSIAPKLSIDDGLDLAKALLSRCVFDAHYCRDGLAALRSYRYEWDEVLGVRSRRPLHDWASDGADAFRTLAVGREERTLRRTGSRRDYRWMA